MSPDAISESILGKIIDIIINSITNFLVNKLKIISPVKIVPKKALEQNNSKWKDISTIKIENRLNKEIYDVTVVGISEKTFSITIISDNTPKEKTVEYIDLNTNHIIAYVRDFKTGHHLWVFRIQKLAPKEIVFLKTKIKNMKDIFFYLSRYSKIEIPIKERDDGAVAIPFQIGKIPEIK